MLFRSEARRAGRRDIVVVGESHAQMPFMTGHAQVEPEQFFIELYAADLVEILDSRRLAARAG